MKTAILSDIHSNLPALNAVLDDAARLHITNFWCLGDVVGYSAWPVQCWKRLNSLEIEENAWVAGNHDVGVIGDIDRYVDGDAKTVLIKHRQACEKAAPDILRQIRKTKDKVIAQPRPGVVLAHGVPKPSDSFWTVTKYTETKEDPKGAVDDLHTIGIDPHLIIVGHTHKSIFWRRRNGGSPYDWVEIDPIGEILINDWSDHIIFMNPGSVGQPRPTDVSREASYCYIDWDSQAVCFRRVPYHIERTREKMQELDYPQTLIDRWYSGSCNWEG